MYLYDEKPALTTGLSHLYRRAYAYDPRKH